ncbi:hypothetical protein [Aneurinibacillus migulanus]|uniref:hypothetical protein n=1 Tax=Aneurinibacillus migulanus TaxID=47500 RepID=UPI0020A158E2|nr:hypothetical protein [Aneurinibacillus migulanus]MCP1357419.1 hypothetical protein [Aneurinibacillus migulanus]
MMPPKKKVEEQTQPTIPLSALPKEVRLLKDNMPIRLYVFGKKQGDQFIITSAELDR